MSKEKGLNKKVKIAKSIDKSGWSDEAIGILKEVYPQLGVSGCIEAGISKKPSTIRMKAKALGIKKLHKIEGWSKEELEVLYKYHNSKKLSELKEMLPMRNAYSIKNKLVELKLSRYKFWSNEELDIIREYYPKGGGRLCIEKGIDKPIYTINNKASKLGVSLQESRKYWTEEEILILRKYYSTEGYDVYRRLEGKTRDNVRYKVNNIRSRHNKKWGKWSRDEEVLLETNITKSSDELKLLIGREVEDIESMKEYLDLRCIAHKWSSEELNILKSNYKCNSASKLKEMGIRHSSSAIYMKLKELGLKSDLGKVIKYKWSDDEDKILIDN